ncbi:hypothetical protein MMC14_002892 [Varicellaria rhodocarpa]|nr:hypothetical protein [Varicellaria rhodocarpa]
MSEDPSLGVFLSSPLFAQELLSTFSLSIGEIALVPSTGGVFTVDIVHAIPGSDGNYILSHGPRSEGPQPIVTRLWDRKEKGGFPEVKHLKQLVRDVVDPNRALGHVDGKKHAIATKEKGDEEKQGDNEVKGKDGCKDCK